MELRGQSWSQMFWRQFVDTQAELDQTLDWMAANQVGVLERKGRRERPARFLDSTPSWTTTTLAWADSVIDGQQELADARESVLIALYRLGTAPQDKSRRSPGSWIVGQAELPEPLRDSLLAIIIGAKYAFSAPPVQPSGAG